MKVIRNDPTPNPDAIKFILEGPLLPAGSMSFKSPADAGDDPLASALFAIDLVESVFVVANVVTVTKDPFGDWVFLLPQIIEAIERATPEKPTESVVQKPPLVGPGFVAESDPEFFERPLDEQINVVEHVLDQYVRPGLAGDGGGLELVDIVGQYAHLSYQGACGTCPSAASMTLGFIEQILRSRVHPDLHVELV